MKKKLLSILLALVMIMSLLPVTALAAEAIPSVEITIDEPVIGASPDYWAEFPEGANYYSEGPTSSYSYDGVYWGEANAIYKTDLIFSAGHAYNIRLYLSPREGYEFTESTTATVNGKNASWYRNGNQIVVQYTFPVLEIVPDLIPSVDITIDEPVGGEHPDYTAEFPGGANYYSNTFNSGVVRNDMEWKDLTADESVDPNSGIFLVGHQYRVIMYISANYGYGFDQSTTAEINGKTANVSIASDQLLVTYDFPVLLNVLSAPEDKTLERNGEKQEIGQPGYAHDAGDSYNAIGVKYTNLTSGDNSIGLTVSSIRNSDGREFVFDPVTGRTADGANPVLYYDDDTQEDLEEKRLTFYAQANAEDLADAPSGTYTATVTYSFLVRPIGESEREVQRTQTLTLVVPIVTYPLWLGNTQANELNKDDILGDGTASYDPETNILTLTTETPAITGLHRNSMICAEKSDLTINTAGKLTLSTPADSGTCIYVPDGSVTINGDVNATGVENGIKAKRNITVNGSVYSKGDYALNSEDSDVTVSGDVTAVGRIASINSHGSIDIGGSLHVSGGMPEDVINNTSVYARYNVTIGGDVTVDNPNIYRIGIWASRGSITVKSGCWDVKGSDYALLGANGINIPDSQTIKTPEGGRIKETGETFFNGYAVFDGNTGAKHVVIEPKPVTNYPLWLGETQVTSANKDDILGDGTASFDPETNTLTFTVETPAITGLHEGAIIYADGIDLTINVPTKLVLNDSSAAYGINCTQGSLTVNGSLKVTVADNTCLALSAGGNITINGDLETVGQVATPGFLTVTGNSNIGTEPVIEYPLWLGEKQVTSENKGDILGDGTASFDPDTNTLTFTTQTPAITGLHERISTLGETTVDNSSLIYSEGINLTIEAPEGLVLNSNRVGIDVIDGNLVVAGDVNIKSESYAIYSVGDVTINGDADLTCTGEGYPIYSSGENGVMITGDLTAKANYFDAIYAYPGGVEIGGSVDIENPHAEGFGIYSRKNVTIGGDTIIKSGSYGIYTAGDVTINGDADLTCTGKGYPIYSSGENGVHITGDLTAKANYYDGIYAYPGGVEIGGSVDIENPHAEGFGIYSRKNVTIGGDTVIESGSYGIYTAGDVTIDGDADLTCTGKGYPIYSSGENGVHITGKLTAKANYFDAVYVERGDIAVDGSVDVVNEYEGGDGLRVGGKIIVASGTWDVTADRYALYANGGIVLPEGYGVTTPEGGKIVKLSNTLENGNVIEYYTVTEADGETVAKHVVIEEASTPVIEYPLWLGDKQVTSANKGDILGDGTASFDPETGTLTFTTQTPNITGTHENALIYAAPTVENQNIVRNDLTINAAEKLILTNNAENGTCIDVAYGSLTVNGSVEVKAASTGLNAFNDIRVTEDVKAEGGSAAVSSALGSIGIGGNVTATGGESGLSAFAGIGVGGNVEATAAKAPVSGGLGGVNIVGSAKATATAEGEESFGISGMSNIILGSATVVSNGEYGIFTYGKATLSSGKWDITGKTNAIFALEGIEIPEGYAVTTPEKGKISTMSYVPGEGQDAVTAYTVTYEDGETIANHAVIEPKPVTEYPLWLGETQVTSANKDDILGDQTASFDPETNTLTFTTETPAITGLHSDALIYANSIDLTVDAAEKLTLTNTVDYGDCVVIYNGALTINGDVDVTGDYYGLRGSSITVNGDVKATGHDALYAPTGDVRIDGDVTVTSDVSCIYAGGSITVNGDVNITSQDYGLYTDEGDIVVTGNVVSNAKGISIRSSGNAIIGGSLTVSGATKTDSYWSSVYVRNDLTVGGNVKVENEVPYDLGIYSYGKVTVVSGRWEAEGNLFAIWAEDGIEIPETHGIVTPENGQVGEATNMNNRAGYSVYAEDGETIAKHAVIAKVRNIKGDVSGDGIVDNRDLILIARYLVHLIELDDIQLAAADWNGDGLVNNSDLVQIARYIVSEQP